MTLKKPLDASDICFEYEKLFGLHHPIGKEVFEDLYRKFSHTNGAFVKNDDNNRMTLYRLGQQSVITYIMAQLNKADKHTEMNNA